MVLCPCFLPGSHDRSELLSSLSSDSPEGTALKFVYHMLRCLPSPPLPSPPLPSPPLPSPPLPSPPLPSHLHLDFSSHVSKILPSSLGHYFILLVPENLIPQDESLPSSQQWREVSVFVSKYRHTIVRLKDENGETRMSLAVMVYY